jgi:trehalose 6-phosphate phosphatase
VTAAPLHHLFSADGDATLAAVLRQRPLLAFDFDGTLAPIVPRPDDARPSQAVSARLAQLATLLPLAIVTGRRVDDVRGRLGFVPHYIVGNHGAEDEGVVPDEPALAAMAALRARIAEYRPALREAGVTVEDKGASIALHYRLSRTRELALGAIAELLSRREESLRVFGGKLVVNIAPRHAPDKAQAVRSLMQRAGATALVFAGDDVNDEPVFEAAGPGWLTIRVGRDDPRSHAMFCLDGPGQMPLLLDRMLALLAA